MSAAFGIIGMGVMGKNLARNMARNGVSLALYNRYLPEVEEEVAKKATEQFAELKNAAPFEDMEEFVKALEKPRKILLMVNAGKPVDMVLDQLMPLLESGDVVIDGGNSHYKDTARRCDLLAKQDLHFVGMGISGGEAGALKGPSLMPGGSKEGYENVSEYLLKIAARDPNGKPCCSYLGPGGAGHFVKMVHNGMEYAEMQLLAEVYEFFTIGQHRLPDEIAAVLNRWNSNELESYLLGITIKILQKHSATDPDKFIVDEILDVAGSKGTGSWTAIAAAELGIPATMVSEALQARYLSTLKQERTKAAELLGTVRDPVVLDALEVRHAYQLARIINHQQTMQLLQEASSQYHWNLELPEIARIWTNGCIIRSSLMEQLVTILRDENSNLFYTKLMKRAVQMNRESMCRFSGLAMKGGCAVPCHTAAVNYLNGYTSARGSANLIQAQRDFFGAHRYRLSSDPEAAPVHTEWDS